MIITMKSLMVQIQVLESWWGIFIDDEHNEGTCLFEDYYNQSSDNKHMGLL